MMWNSNEIDWVMKESVGASGGLLCIWNKKKFAKTKIFTGDGYLRITEEWGLDKVKCNLVNVYGPNDRQKRLKLWDQLEHMIIEEGGRWLIAGDFNAIRCLEEKRGRIGESTNMKKFDEFILAAGLVDIKMVNRHFTWYRPDGTAMSRLDRVLMNVEMCSMGGNWMQQGLKRNISDHCAIVLNSRTTDWGPKPFRILDAWQLHLDFKKVIEEKWSEMEVDGFAGYKCKQKLKGLKAFLKGWNKEVFGNMEAQYEQAAKQNRSRRRCIIISASYFKETHGIDQSLAGLASNRFLQRKNNGWNDHSPLKKLRKGYEAVKDLKLRDRTEVHKNGRLVSGLNSSFLALIPKKFNSMELKDYRPISLIGCVYKLLTKVLANRIKAVMLGIISENQSAFLRGRQLVDGVLVLNEVMEEVKRRKQSAFVFKADFAKAYDCVDWSFLEWMMNRLGFGIKWRGWIMECLSTSKISVLVNGSPTEEFKVGKGLRQGNPLSPFLFLMIGEGLNGLVQKAVSEGMFRGIEIGRKGLVVSLLQFANDTVIMGKADIENIIMVKTILRWFELMSGLQINFSKSNIYGYNVPTRWLEGSASMLRCGAGKSPFIYLGMPVDGKPGNRKLWEPVIKKFRAKLAVWKTASLSFGGRLTLLNSILSALPIFYMSLFLMPNSVVIELTHIQRSFLWGRGELKKKISWVKWEHVCRSKAKGGLGVQDLRRKNWALLGKWWHRFGDGVESLWKRVLTEKYYEGKWKEVDIKAIGNWRVSKLWRDIISIGGRSMRLQNMLVEGFRWEVGEGNRGNICEMGVWEGDKWSWKLEWRRGRIGREKDEEEALWEKLGNLQLKKGVEDRWRWLHDSDGSYMVKKAYEFLAPSEGILEEQLCKVIWCRLVPSKVSFFGWRLCLDKPTKWNIRKRGVHLQEEELMCVCHNIIEEANHLFSMCKEAWILWTEVLQWWNMKTVMPNIVRGVADIFVYDLGRVVGKEMGACIFLVVS
ncbi:hypothetical protein SLEP1_g4255 [Rubroshorea leprosula]|uniref:Reverse transcriptase domain-containing protein n=1 Tax=Rubroshorea leprosula TaxID=152421 RepID=A0AAV5HWZ4_9ROSI|nr:hypothetical protein SLEP1_g4255 [Rubroshorea leprosula]